MAGWLLYKVDYTIRVSRSRIFTHSWYSYYYKSLVSTTPLEYASMLSNPTRYQFSDWSGLCATGVGNLFLLDGVIIIHCWIFSVPSWSLCDFFHIKEGLKFDSFPTVSYDRFLVSFHQRFGSLITYLHYFLCTIYFYQ